MSARKVRPQGIRQVGRFMRYGSARPGQLARLWNVLTVELDENVACSGNRIHAVSAVTVDDGTPGTWYITDGELATYLKPHQY